MKFPAHTLRRRHALGFTLALIPGLSTLVGCAASANGLVHAAPQVKELGRADPGSFFENLGFGPDGALYITDYTRRQVLRYTDALGLRVHATLDVHPLGIAFDTDGTMLLSCQEKSLFGGGGTMRNANLLYRARPGESLRRWKSIEAARFLNGIVCMDSRRMLIADSRGGVIWTVHMDSDEVYRFFTHPLLDAADQTSLTPAANGLKLHKGYLYVSNTARGIFLRLKLNGRQPGEIEVLAENVRADDFAFSPDGRLFFTTHRDKIFFLAGDKPVEYAGLETGISGNTALVWGPDGRGPYVITDGGYVAQQWYGGPTAGPARLLRFSA